LYFSFSPHSSIQKPENRITWQPCTFGAGELRMRTDSEQNCPALASLFFSSSQRVQAAIT
jgi:hypothetical protein